MAEESPGEGCIKDFVKLFEFCLLVTLTILG